MTMTRLRGEEEDGGELKNWFCSISFLEESKDRDQVSGRVRPTGRHVLREEGSRRVIFRTCNRTAINKNTTKLISPPA